MPSGVYQRKIKSMEELFWRKVKKGCINDCWEWQGVKNILGYGFIVYRKEKKIKIQAHRASWIIHKGVIKNGLLVCHHCDNPSCVNPSHLFLGTTQDNMTDKVRKGRASSLHGEKNPSHKLSIFEVVQIRNKYSNNYEQKQLAIDYGVTLATICNIVNNKTWRRVA
jgi:hypothetical protein